MTRIVHPVNGAKKAATLEHYQARQVEEMIQTFQI
jgi:hypothetical protein